MKIYAVVDRKAKEIVSIFTSLSDEAAERSFLMLLTGPKNIFTDFPEDFSLYAIADLTVNGAELKISRPGVDVLNNAGFKCDTFSIITAIKEGVDYDKRYLHMVHLDRFPPENLFAEIPVGDSAVKVNEEEVSTDD